MRAVLFEGLLLNSKLLSSAFCSHQLSSPSCGSTGKESTCNAGDLGSIPGLGRSPGEGKGYPLQYSGLENSMENGIEMENSMDCVLLGVTKSQTQLSDFHSFHKLSAHISKQSVFQLITPVAAPPGKLH